MANIITSYLEKAPELTNPAYLNQKNEAKEAVIKARIALVAAATGSAALSILGLCLSTSGGFSSVVGASILAVSLPASFFAINGCTVAENFMDIIENPKSYKGFTGVLNAQEIKDRLNTNTLGFKPIVSIGVDIMVLEASESKK